MVILGQEVTQVTMNEQELKRKLLVWAGFTFGEYDYSSNYELLFYPDGKKVFIDSSLDFTNSLDACFKWLVPKLYSELEIDDMEIKTDSRRDGYGYACALFGYTKHLQSHSEYVTSPALALCLVIEKLIDEEGKQ